MLVLRLRQSKATAAQQVQPSRVRQVPHRVDQLVLLLVHRLADRPVLHPVPVLKVQAEILQAVPQIRSEMRLERAPKERAAIIPVVFQRQREVRQALLRHKIPQVSREVATLARRQQALRVRLVQGQLLERKEIAVELQHHLERKEIAVEHQHHLECKEITVEQQRRPEHKAITAD